MNRTTCLAAAAIAAAGMCHAGELKIWPRDGMTPEWDPKTSTVVVEDGAVRVTVGENKATWPGVFFPLPKDGRDLRAFARIDVVVTNLSDVPVTVGLSVKSEGTGQRNRPIRLAPHGCGTIRDHIDTTVLLDRKVEMTGLRHGPAVAGDKGLFDAGRVTGCHVYVQRPPCPQTFAVLEVTARNEADRTETVKADDFLPVMDEYGQPRHGDWTGKVRIDADLERARVAEEAWLAAHPPFPDRDKWGGWTKGPQLRATGAFRTEKVDGKWWLVDPDGRLFWSHGIDCVGERNGHTRVSDREALFAPFEEGFNSPFQDCEGWMRGSDKEFNKAAKTYNFALANIRRKYIHAWGGLWKYGELAHRRLHAWGMNTIGDWSHIDYCLMHETPYTVDCTAGITEIEGNRGYMADPFAPDFEPKLVSALANLRKAGVTDDPWCIGIFVNNEMIWGEDDRALGRGVVRSPADQPVKIEMLRRLMEKYGDIESLNAAWGTEYASWDAALASTTVPDEDKAGEDLEECHRIVAEEYFARVAAIVHREAPGRLYLGCRFAELKCGEVAYRMAARYCDVLTANIYMPLPVPHHGHEQGFPDCPMLVGEFYFQARGTGYFGPGESKFTPDERKVMYRDYVERALRDPRFVGTHWFRWGDQPLTGRGLDGENFSCGFVDICDSPYWELVEAAREVGAEMYPLRYGHE